MQPWQIILIVIGGILLLAIIGYIGFLSVTFVGIFSRLRLPREIVHRPYYGEKWDEYSKIITDNKKYYSETPHEEVTVTSFNAKMHGYLYENKKSNKLIVFVHGYYSSGLDDIGMYKDIFKNLGVNLLIIDQRSCGKSQGRYCSFGVLERYDIREWLFYLEKRYQGKMDIYLSGISMGAATVLMTSGLNGLPMSLKGIIADSGYTKPFGVVVHTGQNLMRIRPIYSVTGLNIICNLVGGFSLKQTTVTRQLKKNENIPVLYIHGKKDGFVPYNMGVKNFKSTKAPKYFLSVEDARHVESVLLYEELVFNTIKTFIENPNELTK